MKQPFLDLMDYNAEHPGGDHESFLCYGTKTDGRFGFVPGSRFTECSGTTPYGMKLMESRYCSLLIDFKAFNYEIMKALCESPLPDAVVLNIVDNAINYMIDGDPKYEYTMTYCGYDSLRYGWSSCGCNCLIEWDNRRSIVSLELAYLLQTTGRVKVIPFEERFVPRPECELALIYHPHPGAVDKNGKPFDIEELKRR